MHKKIKKSKKGFTLIELLAVIVILSIVLAISLQTYRVLIANNSTNKVKKYLKIVDKASDLYLEDQKEKLENGECLKMDYKTLEVENLVKPEDVICDGIIILNNDNGKYSYDYRGVRCKIGDEVIKEAESVEDLTCNSVFTSNINTSKEESKTTNSIKVDSYCSDIENGVYKYEFYLDGVLKDTRESLTNITDIVSYNFQGLKYDNGHDYKVKVVCTNGLDKKQEIEENVKLYDIEKPKIKLKSKVPDSGYSYYQKKVVNISYSNKNITKPEYYFKSTAEGISSVDLYLCTGIGVGCSTNKTKQIAAGGIYKLASGKSVDITYVDNLESLVATTYDGVNSKDSDKFSFNDMDKTKPTGNLTAGSGYLYKISGTLSCTDKESGNTKYQIYLYKKGSNTLIDSRTGNFTERKETNSIDYVFEGEKIDQNVEYYVYGYCTNGSGLRNVDDGSKPDSIIGIKTGSAQKPTIIETSVNKGNTWLRERRYSISYSYSEIDNPKRYFKSDVDAVSNVNVKDCGSSKANICSNATTNIKAGNWYLTDTDSLNLTISKTVTKYGKSIYATIMDGDRELRGGQVSYSIGLIDNETPTAPTITGGSDVWSKTDKTISVSNDSTSPSGIKNYQYCISSVASYSSCSWVNIADGVKNVVISNEGTNYIYFRAVNIVGTTGNVSSYQVTKIYKQTPNDVNAKGYLKINGVYSTQEYNPNGFTKYDVKVVVSTTDRGLSGIKNYQYAPYNNGCGSASNLNNGEIEFSSTGTHTYCYRAVDNAGNVSNWKTFTVKIDNKIPTTPGITGGSDAWKNTDIGISINKESYAYSKIDHYEYCQTNSNNSNNCSWSPLTSSEGLTRIYKNETTNNNHYIFARSISNVGLVSDVSNMQIIKIDKTAPTCSVAVSGTMGNNGWYRSGVSFTAQGSDSLSDVASKRVDTSYLASDTSGYTTTATIKDNAGNVKTCSTTVKKDSTAPTCGVKVSGTMGNNGWYTSNVSFTPQGEDSMSNIKSKVMNVYTLTYDTSSFASTATITDNAGNSTSCNSVTVKRDATAPTAATVNLHGYQNDTWTSNRVDRTFVSSDSTSGIAKYQYNPYNSTAVGEQPQNQALDWEGINVARFRAIDNAGNVGPWGDWVTVKIDRNAPTVSYDLPSGTYGAGENRKVNITVADTVGLSSVSVHVYVDNVFKDNLSFTQSLNGATSYTGSVSLNDAGNYTVFTKVTDLSGKLQTIRNEYGWYSQNYIIGKSFDFVCAQRPRNHNGVEATWPHEYNPVDVNLLNNNKITGFGYRDGRWVGIEEILLGGWQLTYDICEIRNDALGYKSVFINTGPPRDNVANRVSSFHLKINNDSFKNAKKISFDVARKSYAFSDSSGQKYYINIALVDQNGNIKQAKNIHEDERENCYSFLPSEKYGYCSSNSQIDGGHWGVDYDNLTYKHLNLSNVDISGWNISSGDRLYVSLYETSGINFQVSFHSMYIDGVQIFDYTGGVNHPTGYHSKQ